MSKSICLVVPESSSACAYYRAILPHRHCLAPLAERGIELVIADGTKDVGDHDAYVFYRAIGLSLFPMVTNYWMQEKRIVWDYDDNFRDLPEWNPAYSAFTPEYRAIIAQCNHITGGFSVTTEPLAKVIREMNPAKSVTVLPNLIDCDDYPTPSLRNDGKVRILWAGSAYHEADLRVIVPALKAVKQEFGDKVEIIFAGYCPDFVRKDEDIDPTMFSWWPVESHGRSLSLIGADLGLCPLSDAPGDVAFNRCKSPVKYFEYAMAGATAFVSVDGPYRFVLNGTGVSVSQNGSWKQLLKIAIKNRLTKSIYTINTLANARTEGRNHVKNCHSWQAESKRSLWVEWFASLVA